MNIFLKIFIPLTIVIVVVLSVITAYQYFGSYDKDTDGPTQIIPETETDTVQQAITATAEADKSFTSGSVKIDVENFMNNEKTFEDPMNPGNYILTGDLGYCLEDGYCLDNQVSDNFSVSFSSNDNVFYIQLLKQPISKARLDTESFLTNVLKISSQQLCELTYYMTVPEYVDADFYGQHLKFSACLEIQQL